jgi:hypothetical protein
MRKVLMVALLFFSCQQQKIEKKPPYDFASQQQLSYLSKFMIFRDSLKAPAKNTDVNANYQKWAIQYWKDNPQIERWLLQVKEINTDDTALLFTLVDHSIPVSFVCNVNTSSPLYNTVKDIHENTFLLATGKLKSSPSFGNANDTTLQRVYLDAVFDTIINMKDSVQ